MDAITRYIPINSAGAPSVAAVACAEQEVRAGRGTILIAAHGWTVTADDFMVEVDQMATGLRPYLDLSDAIVLPIHWKAGVSDDEESIANLFNPLTFFGMATRADQVGANAVSRIIGALIAAAAASLDSKPGGLRFILIGHSFGCRVVCSCLNKLAGATRDLRGATFEAVLFQGAFDCNGLEPGAAYGNVRTLEPRVFATRSPLDRALCNAYRLATGFHRALGDSGPTPATLQAFGDAAYAGGAIDVVDIEPIQRKYPLGNAGVAGSHSNIYLPELFQLVGQFLSPITGAPQ